MAPGSPAATADSPAASSAGSVPTTTARCANRDRVVASDRPMPAGSCPAACVSKRWAWPRSASSLLADSTHGTAGQDGASWGAVA